MFVIIAFGTVAAPQVIEAARIRVSQESYPGAGDFDDHVLGTVEAADFSGRTAAEIYAYGESYYYSYGERGPALRDDTSLIFFAHTTEGLVLFVVHDRVDDPDGGVAVIRLKVEGDAAGAHILVYDDPHGQRDSYEILGSGSALPSCYFGTQPLTHSNHQYLSEEDRGTVSE